MPRAATRSFDWPAWGLALLVVAATCAAFAPALQAEFVNFDDDRTLTHNHAFRGLAREPLAWIFTTSHMGHYQPLAWLSFALEHELWGLGGPSTFPEAPLYHRTSVLVHALGAVAFLFVARELLRRSTPALAEPEGAAPRIALLAALFASLAFAVHPLRAESVAWVTERRDVLSGLLLVLALGAWLRWTRDARADDALPPARASLALASGALAASLFFLSVDLPPGGRLAWRGPGAIGLAGALAALATSLHLSAPAGARRRWLALAVALLVLSLLAKAWGIVMPALLLVLDLCPLRRTRSRSLASLAAEKAPFLALTAIFGALAAWAQRSQGGTVASLAEHSLSDRAAQALYGLAYYPWKTVLPTGLTPHRALPERMSFAEPEFFLPALGVAGLTAALVLARRRAPAALAAWAAFAVIVSPVLGVLQSGPQLVADRYSYLSCLPLAVLAAGALARVALERPRWRAGLAGACALVLAALGALGWRQAAVWTSSESLWERALEVDPADGFAALKLAQVRMADASGAREPSEKRRLAREAASLLESRERAADPDWLSTAAQASRLLAEVEPERRREHLARAVELSARALAAAEELGRDGGDERLNHGATLLAAGRVDESIALLERFVREHADHAVGLANFGTALVASGRHRDALGPLEHAVALEPGYAKAWVQIGLAREALGERAPAIAAFRRVLAIWPDFAPAKARLAALEGG